MNKPPTYAVEALRDVVIRAAMKPDSTGRHREEWILLKAGEVREGLAFVAGVHPASAPHVQPMRYAGIELVLASDFRDADLPKEFFGLYRLSVDVP